LGFFHKKVGRILMQNGGEGIYVCIQVVLIEVFYNRQRRQARLGYQSRLSMSGSSMQGRLQRERVSRIHY
jgi:hypothetical protein